MLASLAALANAGTATPPIVTFPGTQRELTSPDSRFTLIWWGPDAAKTGHSLLLRWSGSPKSWRVYSFARSVTVSWAPSGHAFVVTEMGAEGATTVVQSTSGQKWNVCADSQEAVGTRWSTAHPRYCEHVGWTEREELTLRLRGGGEGASFDTTATLPVPRE